MRSTSTVPGESPAVARRYPIGAELTADGVHFRVWAPAARQVAIVLDHGDDDSHELPLTPEAGGYHAGLLTAGTAGLRYRIKLPGGTFPDPASRFQPEGVHGPSEVVAREYPWTDHAWRGVPLERAVIYELHLGTFTKEGTWRSAMAQLPRLAELGITVTEIMPVAEFPGRFGWGYDGVDLFAPTRAYGSPTDAKAFIDRAHALGLAVILDVVYNHFGPDGNYLRHFAPEFFSRRYGNEWGEALNFDDDDRAGVREYFITNAAYWIEEYHFDGLRLDATQQMYDASPRHILADLAAAAHAAAPDRAVLVMGENETQLPQLARDPPSGGFGLDALWNDDFHHSALVAATGRSEAYYGGYRGRAQEFVSCARHGFLYQGQYYQWQKKRRGGRAFGLRPVQFVTFLQNHDQVANSLHGLRLHQLTSPGRWRALTACLLLLPQVPLLFQGQEFCASAPFLYFADHNPELAEKVRAGRASFLAQFDTINAPESRARLQDPGAEETFRRCQLDWSEAERNDAAVRLHADLLRLRRVDPVLALRAPVEGSVLGEHAFALRTFSADGQDRLLVVNLGHELRLCPAPEPLLAPVDEAGWRVAWSSEDLAYGGLGPRALETDPHWLLPGESAHLLVPDPNRALPRAKLSEKD